MVQEVACKKQSQLQKEYLDQLPLAKERIKNYPILNKYFDNFRSYEDKSYYENSVNIIFKTCIKRPQAFWTPSDSITVLVDSPFFPILLDELETAINHFKIDNMWSIKEKNDLFSRLTSPDPHTSSVVISEILIPYRIDNKIGPNKVKIQSKISSGRRPDNLLDIGNGRQIFLELTSLKPRISEKKIKKICNDLAKYLNNKCKKNNYTIFVHFDTRVLIPLAEPNGHIDELVAKQFLREWADRLLLHELPCNEGSIHFNNNTNTEQSGFLIDIFNDELSTISLPSELCKTITHQDSVRDWAKRVTISDYINSQFETVTYRKATNNECVVVDTVDFDSTSELLQDDKSMVASKAIKKAFKDQVARTINYKIGLQQYVEGTQVIFGINAFEWRSVQITDEIRL
jgi:hypothetical protein